MIELMVSAWLKPPRHLFALFFGVVGIVAVAFTWLSWRVIDQERVIERQRALERRDAEGASLVSSLQRVLLDILEQVGAERPFTDDDAVRAVFGSGGVQAFPKHGLSYYPAIPAARELRVEPFAAADALELTDPGKALTALSVPAQSRDPAVRAGALLRIARIHRKSGAYRKALLAYEELSQIEGILAGGEPVDLAARHALCQIRAEQGDKSGLAQETERLRTDLTNGRWQLSKVVYSLYASWLEISEPKNADLSEAVAELWREWPSARETAGWARVTHIWIGERPVFVFKHAQQGRMKALVARPAFLQRRWRGKLTDDGGRILIGSGDDRPGTVRLPVASGLPWVVHVSTPQTETERNVAAQRRTLVIGGFALISLFAAAAIYFIARAVAREFGLARLQSDFVSAVSHEFRTPLTTMRQLTEMLKKGRVTTEAKRAEYYDLLARESERLQRLIEDLLDFRRMEANASEFTFEPLDPAGLLRGIVADFQEQPSAADYRIELTANGDAPAIRGDRESLRRAVWNLLENAVKYSPSCRTVWLELGEQARNVVIQVRDHGIGIPQHEQASVFQKFVRGREAKSRNISGTGLGLAMVRYIAQSHGGRIEVWSQPGEGSTFTLVLPALE